MEGPIADDEDDAASIAELALFQAAPLVWKDRDGSLHPIQGLDFDREREVIDEALADSAALTGTERVRLRVDSATVDRLGAFLARLGPVSSSGDSAPTSRALHFSCHGAPDYLCLEDGSGGAHFLGVDELRELMDGADLAFVFVSACHSRAAGEAFLAAGAPHVVCCRQDEPLMDAATVEFGRNFYRSLACGGTLAGAFEVGRRSVKLSPSVPNAAEEVEKFLLLPEGADHDVPVFSAVSRRQKRWRRSQTSSQLPPPTWIVPQPPQKVIGRELDIYRVIQALGRARLVRLVGSRGVGKSSVAAAVCRYISMRQRSFNTNQIIWLPLIHPLLDMEGPSSSFQVLFDMLRKEKTDVDIRQKDYYRRACCAIIKSVQKSGTKALVVIDTKRFSDKARRNLSVFLHDLFRGTTSVNVIVVSTESSNISSGSSCVEADVALEPLGFHDAATLFGIVCPHVSDGSAIASTPRQFSTYVVPPDRCLCQMRDKSLSPGDANIFKMIGGGIPSKIHDAASMITREEFDRLLELRERKNGCIQVESRVELERKLRKGEERLRDAIEDQDFLLASTLQIDVDEMKWYRRDLPGLDQLISSMQSLRKAQQCAISSNEFRTAKRIKDELEVQQEKLAKEEKAFSLLTCTIEAKEMRLMIQEIDQNSNDEGMSDESSEEGKAEELTTSSRPPFLLAPLASMVAWPTLFVALISVMLWLSPFFSWMQQPETTLEDTIDPGSLTCLRPVAKFVDDFAVTVPERDVMINPTMSAAALRNRLPSSNFPSPLELVGRQAEIESLELALGPSGRMSAIVGGAGYGKSHLAKTFAREWYEKDTERWGWWLSAETETEIRWGYIQLLAALGLTLEDEGNIVTAQLATVVWEHLSASRGEWILIFDNVPELSADGLGGPELLKTQFFPTPLDRWSRGRILFTSRSSQFSGHTCLGYIEKVSVGPLSEPAAISMLLAGIPREEYDDPKASDAIWRKEETAARRIAMKVHFLPLAIATICGHIRDRDMTAHEYLGEFGLDKVTDSVSLALSAAIEHATSVGLGDILEIVPFVNPETIQLELLQNNRTKANHLCDMNLLRRVRPGVYFIHRLHQDALRKKRSPKVAVEALGSILAKFDEGNSDTWSLGREMLPHIEAIDKHASFSFGDDRVSYARRILVRGGDILRVVTMDLNASFDMYQKALRIERDVNGTDVMNADIARILTNLGRLHCDRGEYESAEAKFEEAFKMLRNAFGPDAKNSELARTLNAHGILHRKLGDYESAEAKFEESLKMQRHVFGPKAKNAELALTLHNLGNVYLHQSPEDFDLAEEMYRESLRIFLHTSNRHGTNALVAGVRNNLAVLYRKRGQLGAAEEEFEEVLKIQRRIYGQGAHNLDIARTLKNQGVVFLNRRNYAAAEAKYTEAMLMLKHSLGAAAPNHRDVIFLQLSLGDLKTLRARAD